MEKCWYVIIEGATLGPYDLFDLRHKPGFNPDTLVWKDGFEGWISARSVTELDDLFKDAGSQKKEDESPILSEETVVKTEEISDETLVLDQGEPPYTTVWFLIALAIFIYLIYQVYFN